MTAPARVLVVEDDPDHARLTARALEAAEPDVEVDHAATAGEAVQAVLGDPGQRPDLVLLDLDLGPDSGIDVLERLRARPAGRLVPVVVLTTSTDPGDRRASYRQGANGFVVRPTDHRALEERIEATARYWLEVNETAEPA